MYQIFWFVFLSVFLCGGQVEEKSGRSFSLHIIGRTAFPYYFVMTPELWQFRCHFVLNFSTKNSQFLFSSMSVSHGAFPTSVYFVLLW